MGAEDMLADLAGDVRVQVSEQHAWTGQPPVVLVEQDLGVARYAAWVPVTREMLEDAGVGGEMAGIVNLGIDRALRPWRYADRPAWPTFVVVPALDRAIDLADGALAVTAEARRRLTVAWRVLRWGSDDLLCEVCD